MSDRFPGGVISKTPPTIVGPTDGEGGSTSGVWSLSEVLEYETASYWPKPFLPRSLYAWGNNGTGSLGDGTVINRSSPVLIGSADEWSSFASYGHSVAVKRIGSLWAWGLNNHGQLGLGDTVNTSSPVQVGALTTWSQVAAGDGHTLALKENGTLWAWGLNNGGQLGTSNTTRRSSPVQVAGSWVTISAGETHSGGIKTDGVLYMWGSNGKGQLGINLTTDKSSPTAVGALTNWSTVSLGRENSSAIKTDGTLWTWGYNVRGQIGDSTSGINKSSPVQIGALTNWRKTSIGFNNILALKTDNTLWGWGSPNAGVFTVSGYRSSPVQIGALTDWSDVETSAAGASRQHVLALKTNGTIWAWGNNQRGQLGNGSAADLTYSTPAQLGSITTWTNVTVGDRFSLAILK